MYARVTKASYAPDQAEAVVRYMRDTLLPTIRQIPGVTAGYFLLDRQHHTGNIIVVYESEAALHASDATAQQMRAQTSQDFSGLGTPSVETYEVIGTF